MIAESEISTARVPFAGPDIPSDDVINKCVHCGLCLSSCPTYRETGLEMFSPRGRIYLMKAVAEGRIGMESDVFQEQMSACLNCRACTQFSSTRPWRSSPACARSCMAAHRSDRIRPLTRSQRQNFAQTWFKSNCYGR